MIVITTPSSIISTGDSIPLMIATILDDSDSISESIPSENFSMINSSISEWLIVVIRIAFNLFCSKCSTTDEVDKISIC